MGVRILSDNGDSAVLYCSTSEWAFGPVFSKSDDHDAEERALAFCRWLGVREPRRMTDRELSDCYSTWLAQEAVQWATEEAADAAQWAEEDTP